MTRLHYTDVRASKAPDRKVRGLFRFRGELNLSPDTPPAQGARSRG